MLQAIELHRLLPGPAIAADPRPAAPGGHTGLESVEVPAGACTLGAGRFGFSYDNERPRHRAELPAFRIGRTPVTNATWLTFAEGGGYERREWWSDEGWSWKEDYDITHPGGWAAWPGRMAAVADRRMGAAGPRRAGRPRVLVRGRCLRTSARRAPPHGGGVGEGSDLGPAHRPGAQAPVGRRAPVPAPRQPRPDGPRPAPRRLAPRGRLAMRRARHARRRLGVDRERLPRLRRLRRPPLPRVLRGVLRRPLQGAARRLVGEPRARDDRDDAQLGPPAAAADLLAACDWRGTHERRTASTSTSATARSARCTTTCSTASRARRRSCRPSTSTTPTAASCSTASPSSPSTTRRAPSARSSARAPARSSPPRRWRELVELGSGTATKTRVLLDAATEAGMLRRYVPFDVAEAVVRESRRPARRGLPGARACTGSSATSSATSARSRPPSRAARACSPSSAARSATSCPARAGASCASSPRCWAPTTALLLGTDLVKDPDVLEAAYDDAAGVTAAVQPQRADDHQPRAGRRLPGRALRARRLLRPGARAGSRCACARAAPAS